MPRGRKKNAASVLDEDEAKESKEEPDLPKDEAGRLKIKKNYEELLGIRIEKLKGRILNRERINKSVEGIYFICAGCRKVCHSLDEGLVVDPRNEVHLCSKCGKEKAREWNGLASKGEDGSRHLGEMRDWLSAGNR